MNWKAVLKILGKILIAEAAMLLLPIIVAAISDENTYWGFVIPILILLALGIPTYFIKADNEERKIYAKEGFLIVAFAWIALAAIGAIPFVITKSIPHYVDALFETISGFTTTGASVLSDVESLPRSILFWRSFTNWIGGMGVLVFLLAVLPRENSGIIHAFRAEATGPSVGKLTSKMGRTARILYAIYIALTLTEMLFLLFKMPVFDAVTTALANAGTGGFSVRNASIASYGSLYVEIVITVFMFLFSLNFNIYFLILTGHVLKGLKSEEAIVYTLTVLLSIFAIALNVYFTTAAIHSFGEAMRYSSFQVLSLSSTTGFSSYDYNSWPTLSKVIMLFLMTTGGMAGSTAGGIKMSRLMILGKSTGADIRRMVHPREIVTVKLEGEPVHQSTIQNVRTFFVTWVAILIVCTLLISVVDYTGDFLTNFSASLSCVSNIGPGFNGVGPAANFGDYSYFSKIVLSVEMLFGRLEIFPLIVLFSPATYSK